jgi:hypothetical protein
MLNEPDTFWNSLLHDTVLQHLQVHKSPILSHKYQLQKSAYFDKSVDFEVQGECEGARVYRLYVPVPPSL